MMFIYKKKLNIQFDCLKFSLKFDSDQLKYHEGKANKAKLQFTKTSEQK